jgi:hypothetical protein
VQGPGILGKAHEDSAKSALHHTHQHSAHGHSNDEAEGAYKDIRRVRQRELQGVFERA